MSTTTSQTAAASGGTEATPDAPQISALLAELRVTRGAVDNKEWLSAGLAGEPVVSLDMLNSTARPLSSLDSAGMGFLTPMISFLEEPLDQLRGNPEPVTSGASQFDEAGRGATAVAERYRSTAGGDTSQWSGKAASDYLKTGTELATGILSIAETSLTSAKAIIHAGEVVAQVVAKVTELIAEAVGKITPIMAQAIAEAPVTFGQSIAKAIPECVGIAADYAGRIAAKLAELLTSGENLIKLLEGAAAVVKIVKEVLTFIGKQSQGGGSPSTPPGKQSQAPSGQPSSTGRSNPPTTPA